MGDAGRISLSLSASVSARRLPRNGSDRRHQPELWHTGALPCPGANTHTKGAQFATTSPSPDGGARCHKATDTSRDKTLPWGTAAKGGKGGRLWRSPWGGGGGLWMGPDCFPQRERRAIAECGAAPPEPWPRLPACWQRRSNFGENRCIRHSHSATPCSGRSAQGPAPATLQDMRRAHRGLASATGLGPLGWGSAEGCASGLADPPSGEAGAGVARELQETTTSLGLRLRRWRAAPLVGTLRVPPPETSLTNLVALGPTVRRALRVSRWPCRPRRYREAAGRTPSSRRGRATGGLRPNGAPARARRANVCPRRFPPFQRPNKQNS